MGPGGAGWQRQLQGVAGACKRQRRRQEAAAAGAGSSGRHIGWLSSAAAAAQGSTPPHRLIAARAHCPPPPPYDPAARSRPSGRLTSCAGASPPRWTVRACRAPLCAACFGHLPALPACCGVPTCLHALFRPPTHPHAPPLSPAPCRGARRAAHRGAVRLVHPAQAAAPHLL